MRDDRRKDYLRTGADKGNPRGIVRIQVMKASPGWPALLRAFFDPNGRAAASLQAPIAMAYAVKPLTLYAGKPLSINSPAIQSRPEGREAPKTDADRAVAFKTMVSYTGIYRIEGDHWITKVDVSWNESWVGTEQSVSYAVR